MSKVVLVKCESYDYQDVKAAVEKGIDLLGGPLSFIKPGEKNSLKPNWLAAVSPDKCATTHPVVFQVIAEIFKRFGAKLTYGDSPAFHSPEAASKKTGFEAVASALEIDLADFIQVQPVHPLLLLPGIVP